METHILKLCFLCNFPPTQQLCKDIEELLPNISDCSYINRHILVECVQEAPNRYEAEKVMIDEIKKYYPYFKYISN